MTIELECAGCRRVLKVADEQAGKQARCPVCGQISLLPGVAVASGDVPSFANESHSQTSWSMRTPEGQVYGPIARSELDRWLAEGRVTADCELSGGTNQPWQAADQLYPQLRPVSYPSSYPSSYPNTYAGAASQTPAGRRAQLAPPYTPDFASESTFAMPAGPSGYSVPHRGGTILVLGILGLFFGCPIFSLMAWVMGSSDLRDMQSGRMDRSGEGLTQVGHVLGAILSVLWIAGCMLAVSVIILAAAAGR